MFDPFTLALIGGAAGGLLNKKDPLKGALLGAGAGFTGGTLAAGGGLLGAAPAATGASGAAGTAGAAAGATSAATSGASMASSLPAFNPIAGTYVNATSLPGMTGFTETLKGVNAAVKPFGEAAGTAMQVRGLFQDNNAPMPVAQSSLPARAPMDVTGLLGNGQVAQLNQKRMARRGLMG